MALLAWGPRVGRGPRVHSRLLRGLMVFTEDWLRDQGERVLQRSDQGEEATGGMGTTGGRDGGIGTSEWSSPGDAQREDQEESEELAGQAPEQG